MTSTEILSRADITAVWRQLGGGDLRHGRGKAFWRNGDGLNITVNADKGTWYDHAHGEGGGILRLVQTVRGGTAQEALKWLAESLGVPLDEGAGPTPAEKRDFAADKRKLQRAKWWRIGYARALENAKRNSEAFQLSSLAAGRLFELERMTDQQLLWLYREFSDDYPQQSRSYESWGREDEQFSAALTKFAVGILAEAEGA